MKAIVFYISFIITQFVASIFAVFITEKELEHSSELYFFTGVNPVILGLSLLVCETILSVILWLFFKKNASEKHISTCILKISRNKQVLNIVAILFFTIGLSLLLKPFQLSDGGMQDIFEEMKGNVLCLVQLCIVGPFCEEIVFRRGILQNLSQTIPNWFAVFISALTFAFIHGNLAQGIPAFIIGCIFGLMYLRTHNLQLCFPAHVANNTLAVFLMYFPQISERIDSCSIALILFISLCFLLLGVFSLFYVIKK